MNFHGWDKGINRGKDSDAEQPCRESVVDDGDH